MAIHEIDQEYMGRIPDNGYRIPDQNVRTLRYPSIGCVCVALCVCHCVLCHPAAVKFQLYGCLRKHA